MPDEGVRRTGKKKNVLLCVFGANAYYIGQIGDGLAESVCQMAGQRGGCRLWVMGWLWVWTKGWLLHPAAGVFHLLPFLAEALFGDRLGGAQFRGKDGDTKFFQEFQVFLLAELTG